jgi:hypothetical protein
MHDDEDWAFSFEETKHECHVRIVKKKMQMWLQQEIEGDTGAVCH